MKELRRVTDREGRVYLPVADVADLANTSDADVRARVSSAEKDGRDVSTTDNRLLANVPGGGRRPSMLVSEEFANELRSEFLESIGVAGELRDLRAELDDVRRAWEQDSLALQGRIQVLEASLASLVGAMKARLNATLSNAEADRLWLGTVEDALQLSSDQQRGADD